MYELHVSPVLGLVNVLKDPILFFRHSFFRFFSKQYFWSACSQSLWCILLLTETRHFAVVPTWSTWSSTAEETKEGKRKRATILWKPCKYRLNLFVQSGFWAQVIYPPNFSEYRPCFPSPRACWNWSHDQSIPLEVSVHPPWRVGLSLSLVLNSFLHSLLQDQISSAEHLAG